MLSLQKGSRWGIKYLVVDGDLLLGEDISGTVLLAREHLGIRALEVLKSELLFVFAVGIRHYDVVVRVDGWNEWMETM